MKTFLNNITLEEFISLLDGEIHAGNSDVHTPLSYICTDSREAEENSVFVALVGERTDGHKYISTATEKGALLVICEHLPENPDSTCTYVVTENSEKALSFAARNYRNKYCPKLKAVAVTGSVGKTTAKEMIYAALSSKLDVYKTDGNFNSVIGMPISLLGMDKMYEYAVFEMGMSGLGEINSMSTAAQPYIGVITNVGHSHLEYLKTRENILKAKLEIADGIPSNGYLVINGDDEMLSKADLSRFDLKIIRCSQKDENADYYAFNIRATENRSMLFDYISNGHIVKDVEVFGMGAHLVTTALCAIAVGKLLGLSAGDCAKGFLNFKNAAMRQNIIDISGVTVIEDCYNAAPESMRSALDAMKCIKAQRSNAKAVALLGDMKELGENSPALHKEIGKYAVKCGADILIAVGALSKNTADGAIEAGLDRGNVYRLESLDDMQKAGALLDALVFGGDVLLVKASRSMQFERAVEYLKGRA